MLDPVSYSKQPWEVETIGIDWAERIASGDSLSSQESKIYDDDGNDKTTEMVDASSISGNLVFISVKAGDAGKEYHLRCRVTTANGQKYEEDLTIFINQEGY